MLRHSGSDWPCHVSFTHCHWWGKTSPFIHVKHQPLAHVLAGVSCVAEHPQFNLPPKICLAGDSQPLDVCSVHQASAPSRYSVSLLGYGFYGDVLAESEKHRWMGPLRYDFSGTDCWVKWTQTGFIAVMKCDTGHMPSTSFFSVNHFLVFRHNGVSLQQELCRHSSVYPSKPSALQSKRQNSLPLRVKH